MLDKFEILIVIFILLLAFYLVIFLGAGKKKKAEQSNEIKKYLFNVRILIIVIGIFSFILWLFL